MCVWGSVVPANVGVLLTMRLLEKNKPDQTAGRWSGQVPRGVREPLKDSYGSDCLVSWMSRALRGVTMGLGESQSTLDVCVYVHMCTHMTEKIVSWRGKIILRAHMSRHHQLGRLQSRGSYWADWVPEPSCWSHPPTPVHTYSLLLFRQRGEQDDTIGVVSIHVKGLCSCQFV